MHELGLMDAVIKKVKKLVEAEGLTQVDKIVMEVGELSGIVPRFLEDCFKAVVADTPYETTILEIEIVPGTARCNDCQITFTVNVEDLCCIKCHGKNLTPLTGKDLTIKAIEAS